MSSTRPGIFVAILISVASILPLPLANPGPGPEVRPEFTDHKTAISTAAAIGKGAAFRMFSLESFIVLSY
jgi:hypothetical protein